MMFTYSNCCDVDIKISSAIPTDMSSKHVSKMYFREAVESEIRENPLCLHQVRFKGDDNFEVFMREVEEKRDL